MKIQFLYGTFIDEDFNYSINEYGQVFNWIVPKYKIKNRKYPFQPSIYICNKGYKAVSLNGKLTRIHNMLAAAFIGPANGLYVRHLDGDQLNNSLSNLAFGTPKDNSQDMVAHGRSTRGSKQPNSKLTEQDVVEIVNLLLSGKNQKEIAEIYNINDTTIRDIKKGKTWSHLNLYQQFVGLPRTYNKRK